MRRNSGSAAVTNTTRAELIPRPVFLCVSALFFAASVAATVYFCRSMAGGMDMPGGWTMSMAWMRMPGQSWPAAAAMFMSMWLAMMVAMMLPAVAPMLSRADRPLWVACAYFLVWTAVGVPIFAIGILLAHAAMRWESFSRFIPPLAGISLLIAGAFQFTRWKISRLSHCCNPLNCGASPAKGTRQAAIQQGIRFGRSCVICCSGFMVGLLVLGMMNLYVIATMTMMIALERLSPRHEMVARVFGIGLIGLGLFLIARAAKLA